MRSSAYAIECLHQGLGLEYVASLRDLAEDFEAYRAKQGDGDPDAPPHRIDDPGVIRAMRGIDATFRVICDKGNVKKER